MLFKERRATLLNWRDVERVPSFVVALPVLLGGGRIHGFFVTITIDIFIFFGRNNRRRGN
jgi:hypothetical protein